MLLPQTIEFEAERARRSLSCFVEQAWGQVEPAHRFSSNWHIDAICEHLEAVARGEITRLIINIPPRHGKSLLTSVLFVPWVWATTPPTRFLYASYAQTLALRDSVATRRLLASPWYRKRFGHVFELTGDLNQQARFSNDKTGERLATSVGGHATGEGGDIIVIDDPHKLEDAHSPAQLERTTEWFSQTMLPRLDDPERGAFVVIGQRVHEADLCGELLSHGGWEHLCLPAEHDPAHPFTWPRDPRTEPGQLLWPDHISKKTLQEQKRHLGTYAAAAQLQQCPAPAAGAVLPREWWRYYQPSELPRLERIVQSWDLSFTDRPGADYVVGQAWGKAGPDLYLLHQTRKQLSFIDTIKAIRALNDRVRDRFPDYPPCEIAIEEAANGAAAISTLKRTIPGVIAVRPQGSKVSRANAISDLIEAGNVYLPGAANHDATSYDRVRTPAWVQALIEEAAAFPNGAHDDTVDAMTQAILRLRRRPRRPRVCRVR